MTPSINHDSGVHSPADGQLPSMLLHMLTTRLRRYAQDVVTTVRARVVGTGTSQRLSGFQNGHAISKPVAASNPDIDRSTFF